MERQLLLNDNQFTSDESVNLAQRDAVPTELGRLTMLETRLFLQSNELHGTFPTQMGALTELKSFLYMHDNTFCNDLPTDFGTLIDSMSIGGLLPSDPTPYLQCRQSRVELINGGW